MWNLRNKTDEHMGKRGREEREANHKTLFPYTTLFRSYTYHIFFIRSSIDGHLGSSHTLAIVDGAAVNMGEIGRAHV